MIITNVGLEIPDSLISAIESGELIRTNGVLRNADTMRIEKHLPIVEINEIDKDSWDKLKDDLKDLASDHKEEIVVIGLALVAVSICGGIAHHIRKSKKNKVEQANVLVNQTIAKYIKATREGNLTIDIIDECIDALTDFTAISDKIFNKLTEVQITELSHALSENTKALAKTNGVNLKHEERLDIENNNVIGIMLMNLKTQKQIFENAA